MAPPAKRQKFENAPRRALTRRAREGEPFAARGKPFYKNNIADDDIASPPQETAANESGDDDDESVDIALSAPSKPAASYNALLASLGATQAQNGSRKKQKRSRKLRFEDSVDVNEPLGDQHSGYETLAREEPDQDVDRQSEEDHDDVIDPYAPVEEDDASDPFEAHFANPDENELAAKLAAISNHSWKRDEAQVRAIGKLQARAPDQASSSTAFIHQGLASLKDTKLKKRWAEAADAAQKELDPVHEALTPVIFSYADLLFGGRTVENAPGLRQLCCLHALNHIFKTRDKVLKNTAKLARDQQSAVEYRDQGFTRPKVLFLLETRQSCVRYMDAITQLAQPDQQENRKRFLDAFSRPEDDFSGDRPADFRELFSGNDDNDFRLGVKFTRKTLKYFSQFYSSDIIFASPLGLRRAMRLDDPKKADYDFLSSIEVVVVDQADAMLQQNWDHVEHVFAHLNLQPKQAHGCDFGRVRRWYLDGHARHLRQTIVLSAYATPELNGLCSSQMQNVVGNVRIQQRHEGSMIAINNREPIRQTFVRFNSSSPATEPDARFKYFLSAVLPTLTRDAEANAAAAAATGDSIGVPLGALIFIPSYLDFVRVRNHLAKEEPDLSFGVVSEYTSPAEVRRARAHFSSGRHAVLLYTGRAHHFRRYRLRGVRRVVLYGLPDNPLFYSEIVGGFLGNDDGDSPDAGHARAIFSRWDGLALARVVGGARAARMVGDAGDAARSSVDTYEFF